MSEWIPSASTFKAANSNVAQDFLLSTIQHPSSAHTNGVGPTLSTPRNNGTVIVKPDEDFLHEHLKLVLGIGLPVVLLLLAALAFYTVGFVRRKLRQRRFLRELLPDYSYDQSEAVFDGYTQYSDSSSIDMLVPKSKVYWLPDQISASEPNLALLPDSPEPGEAGSEELLHSVPV